jgi:SOS response regulatory protein OraA/RecX
MAYTESERLKYYYLNLLKKRDYSYHELEQKARRKTYTPETTEQVLLELQSIKFIDDQRLAENLVRAYHGSKGLNWIKNKLRQKFIASDIIKEVLAEETEMAPTPELKENLRRKYKLTNLQDLDQKTKAKLLGNLQRKGFTNPFEILRQWQEEEENEES